MEGPTGFSPLLAGIVHLELSTSKGLLQYLSIGRWGRQFPYAGDYTELLNFIIIFLEGIPTKGISFTALAGLHRARWLTKAIYSLKIYLFRWQFKLTQKESIGILDIFIFTVRIYIKH